MNWRRFAFWLYLLPLLFTLRTSAITINSVNINYANNQITIVGRNLSQNGNTPLVTFNATNLKVTTVACVSQPIDCDLVVAVLPNSYPPGTYRLTVNRSRMPVLSRFHEVISYRWGRSGWKLFHVDAISGALYISPS